MIKKEVTKMKVYIADDSSIMRKYLFSLFSEIKGIEIVGQAQRGDEAVGSIKRLKPDVVILDIRMPGGSGVEALQKIKKENPDITVIMFTNYPYPQYKKKCMEAGADFFLDKSTEFDKIPEILKTLKSKS